MVSPFRISVYDKTFTFKCRIADPAALLVTPRHLALGTGQLTLELNHRHLSTLMAEGARVVIEYLVGTDVTDDASWLHLISGPIWERDGTGPSQTDPKGSVVFNIEDDYRVLNQVLAWQNPTAAIGSQTANAFDTQSGAAETVIKHYAHANIETRLGLPLTVATDSARGGTVKANARMANLNDLLPPLAQLGGLGITVKQSGSGYILDVYVPTDRTARVLTESSGAVLAWTFTQTGPYATRAIIGSTGTGTSRGFSQVTDSTGLEALWGTIVEVFADGSSTSDSTSLAGIGEQTLAAGLPQAGFALTIGETPVVKYGKNLFVGDLVAVAITDDLTVTDVLSEVTLAWDGNGLTVTPQVGQSSTAASPNARLARAISRLNAKVRQIVSNT